MKRHHVEKEVGGEELIYYITCDQSVIDQISGYKTTFGVEQYVLDPLDASRYCFKKVARKLTPIQIWDGLKRIADPTGLYSFVLQSSPTYPTETINKVYLAGNDNSHRVEFDLYLDPLATNRGNGTRPSSVFDNAGIGNFNSNALQAGVTIIIQNNILKITYRNNSSSYFTTIVGNCSDLGGVWIHVRYTAIKVSEMEYKVLIDMYDGVNLIIDYSTPNLILPMVNTRPYYAFFSDTSGSGA